MEKIPKRVYTKESKEITEYTEISYNRQRRHSKLGNLAPAVFAQQWQQQAAA